MDLNGLNRFPNRKPTPTERFLGVPSRASPTTNTAITTADELNEDDVVFFSNDYHNNTEPNNNNSHKGFPFAPPDSFGILAALPENETATNLRNVSKLFHNHKASISTSTSTSSSSSRPIPRPPSQERISSLSSSVKYHHQSAPVNVPILSEAMMKARRRHREFDEWDDGEDEDEEEEMLPPHEIVARNSAKSPMLSCSVLEGVGRTLKGRDLRRVRNAVWRQIALLFALALARIDPSTCQTVKGKVFCVDCTHTYDLSDIKVLVKCEGVKKLAVANTEDNGSFKVDLPSGHTKPSSVNCLVKILGGAVQLYASRKNQVSQIVKDKEQNSYTISTPLSFLTSCPQNTKCKAANMVGSSKTVDLPLPPEWGLAPSSYYVPFIPIIGIP